MVDPKVPTNNFEWEIPGESLTPYPHYSDIVSMMNGVDDDMNSIIPQDRTVAVKVSDNAVSNAANLLNAYNKAKTLFPTLEKQVTVLLPPGEYDFAATPFLMDTDYINLLSTTPARRSQWSTIPLWTDVKHAGATIKTQGASTALRITAARAVVAGVHAALYGTSVGAGPSCIINPAAPIPEGPLLIGCSFGDQGLITTIGSMPQLYNCHSEGAIHGRLTDAATGGIVSGCSACANESFHSAGSTYSLVVENSILNYEFTAANAVLGKVNFKNCRIFGDVPWNMSAGDSNDTHFENCYIEATGLLDQVVANASRFTGCILVLTDPLNLGSGSWFRGGSCTSKLSVDDGVLEIKNCRIATGDAYAVTSLTGSQISEFPITCCILESSSGIFAIDPLVIYSGANIQNSEWTGDATKLKTTGMNNTGLAFDTLDVVYVTASATGIPDLELGIADLFDESRIIGLIAEGVADGDPATVYSYGPLWNQDTSAWPDNTPLYLDHLNRGKLTLTMPVGDSYCIQVCKVLKSHATEGVLFVDPHISEYTRELNFYTGWPSDPLAFMQTEFDKTTRTLTLRRIGEDWNVYQKGQKYILGTEDGGAPGEYIDEFILADTEGLHFVYYDNGVMAEIINPTPGQVSTAMRANPFVTFMTLDNSTPKECVYLGKEFHQFTINPTSHSLWHFNVGATWQGGLSLNGFTIGNGNADVDAQFGVDAGFLSDEDLFHLIGPYLSTEGIPVMYLEGATTWKRDFLAGFSVKRFGAGRLAWNELTGGMWQQTEVGNLDFVLCHIFGTNDCWDTVTETCTGKGCVALQGQNDYLTLALAQAGAQIEISSLVNLSPFEEMFPIATIIFQTSNGMGNAVQAAVVLTEDAENYVNWLNTEFSQAPPPSSHLSLNDLNGGSDGDAGHTKMVVKDGRALGQVIIGGTGANENLELQSTSNAAKGNVFLNAGQKFKRDTIAIASHTTALGEYALDFSYTPTGLVAVTLADVTAIDGLEFVLSDIGDNASNNEITVTPESGTIMGEPNLIINGDGDSVTVYHNGIEWRVK